MPELAEWNCFACHHDLRSAELVAVERHKPNDREFPSAGNAWPYAILEPLANKKPASINSVPGCRV